MISGKGFNNAINKEEVICRFRFSDDKFFDKKATTVDDNTITCSGVMIQKPDQLVHVEVSLNNAISFIKSDANITSDNCMSARVRWQVPSWGCPEHLHLRSTCPGRQEKGHSANGPRK
uniref:anthrax toxin receptor-like n=1 Tax=Panthera onca TaxID=9690 RepID=UPI00295407C8|nr:anthrax toxin receptor-like [Panthera onca]